MGFVLGQDEPACLALPEDIIRQFDVLHCHQCGDVGEGPQQPPEGHRQGQGQHQVL